MRLGLEVVYAGCGKRRRVARGDSIGTLLPIKIRIVRNLIYTLTPEAPERLWREGAPRMVDKKGLECLNSQ